MSFYRDKYLRSDHWQNLRLKKLVKKDAKCELCGRRNVFNDVHHLQYRRLYDVKLLDLKVLCRSCHKLIHQVMEHTSGWRSKVSWCRWKRLRHVAARYKELSMFEHVPAEDRMRLAKRISSKGFVKPRCLSALRGHFKKTRRTLREQGKILKRYDIQWSVGLLKWLASRRQIPSDDEVLLVAWKSFWKQPPVPVFS